MSRDELVPDSGHDTVLYALFLSFVSGKALTPAIIDQHTAHLAKLDDAGQLVIAGPMPTRSGGLIVLKVASLAAAKAIADADPMVRGGFQTYELVAWPIANRQNKYRPNAPQAGKP